MPREPKTNLKTEFGDFQTPELLAESVCEYLLGIGLRPRAIVEPTCGKGNFLLAAMRQFVDVQKGVGVEINPEYLATARRRAASSGLTSVMELVNADCFDLDWNAILSGLPKPILVVGNPPWVTNSEIRSIGGSNLPQKGNFQNQRGLDAVTGKSNFDISEWILLQTLDWVEQHGATVAMLCKTTVARKVLHQAWERLNGSLSPRLCRIDAKAIFGASVDACLLVLAARSDEGALDCPVYEEIGQDRPQSIIGYRDGLLVARVRQYEKHRDVLGPGPTKWRSGIKHDCAKVMELRRVNDHYENGFHEVVDIEETCLYPMLKSSDLASKAEIVPKRWMLVTQEKVGQETKVLKSEAPKTWRYLMQHAHLLDARASTIYRNRPSFSMFGVGPYTFSPYKVAISGFYKELSFNAVGSFENKPIVFDDTCYFLPCADAEDCSLLLSLLNSQVAQEFYSALTFWDAKRPVTATMLQKLNLLTLAERLGRGEAFRRFLVAYRMLERAHGRATASVLPLFDKGHA